MDNLSAEGNQIRLLTNLVMDSELHVKEGEMFSSRYSFVSEKLPASSTNDAIDYMVWFFWKQITIGKLIKKSLGSVTYKKMDR